MSQVDFSQEDAGSRLCPGGEEPTGITEDKWIRAAFFDLEAEVERQAKAIRELQRLCRSREHSATAQFTEILSRMRRGNSAMHDIIRNANNIHGNEQSGNAPEEKPHDLRAFLDHFTEMSLERAKSAGIGFRGQYQDIRDRAVRFDQEKMTRILTNLLIHMISRTDAGGRITLQVRQEEDGGSGCGAYVFDMSHTGIGMSDREIRELFDLNRQVERGALGSALGLSVAKQTAELMGGEIRVEARTGMGNSYIVRVTLPLMSSEDSGRIIADKRILLVDDNLLNSEIVAEILREAGAVVEIVSSGEEAVDMVSNFYEGYYDIVLTDIEMTGIDGYKTASRIREIPWATRKGLKIIALSSFEYDAQKDRDEGRAFNAYCMKPFDLRKFVAAAFGNAEEGADTE